MWQQDLESIIREAEANLCRSKAWPSLPNQSHPGSEYPGSQTAAVYPSVSASSGPASSHPVPPSATFHRKDHQLFTSGAPRSALDALEDALRDAEAVASRAPRTAASPVARDTQQSLAAAQADSFGGRPSSSSLHDSGSLIAPAIARLERSLESLERDMRNSKSSNDAVALSSLIADLEERLRSVESSMQQSEASVAPHTLEARVEDAMAQITDLQQRLRDAEADSFRLDRALETAVPQEQLRSAVESSLDSLHERAKEIAQDEAARLAAESETAQREARRQVELRWNEERNRHLRDLETLRKDVEQLLQSSSQEVQSLQDEVSALRGQLQGFRRTVDEECERVHSLTDTLRRSVHDSEEWSRSAAAEDAQLQEQVQELLGRLRDAHHSHRQAERQLVETRERVEREAAREAEEARQGLEHERGAVQRREALVAEQERAIEAERSQAQVQARLAEERVKEEARTIEAEQRRLQSEQQRFEEERWESQRRLAAREEAVQERERLCERREDDVEEEKRAVRRREVDLETRDARVTSREETLGRERDEMSAKAEAERQQYEARIHELESRHADEIARKEAELAAKQEHVAQLDQELASVRRESEESRVRESTILAQGGGSRALGQLPSWIARLEGMMERLEEEDAKGETDRSGARHSVPLGRWMDLLREVAVKLEQEGGQS